MRKFVAPPFTDVEDARDFYFLLMVFLRELKRPGEPVSLHQYLLAQAMHHHQPANRDIACRSCGPPYPCATVLSIALTSRLPAPWTPKALGESMTAAGLLPAYTVRSDAIYWGGGDYTIDLHRGEDGNWSCHERQRSDASTYAIGDDRACCDFLARRAREHPVGLGWRVTEDELDVIRPGIGPVRAWWLEHSSYPYLVARLPDGEQASLSGLQPGDMPDPFIRLPNDDAMNAVQNAARVIPPGHVLYGRLLYGLAKCERCYRAVLFSYDDRFALVQLNQVRDREESPKPTAETFASYTEAHTAMEFHAQICTGRGGR
ncbi:hypothetical protein [Mycobacterium seoulense]|uniref:hypothetical protein n=1 Tax=Mycobacterium seoulense TaxID=386911 RepID=UPI003CEE7D0C